MKPGLCFYANLRICATVIAWHWVPGIIWVARVIMPGTGIQGTGIRGRISRIRVIVGPVARVRISRISGVFRGSQGLELVSA